MLRKILEKVLITKKFTQCKASRTLKPRNTRWNKNIENFLSKYELLFLDQANSWSDPFKLLILQFLIPIAFLLPSPSLSNLTLVNWNPSLTKSSSCSSSVYLFCPTLLGHMPPQMLDIPNHIHSQASQIYCQAVYRS